MGLTGGISRSHPRGHDYPHTVGITFVEIRFDCSIGVERDVETRLL